MNDEWNRYMGPHITPEQYAAEGGDESTIRRDLMQMWGDPAQGDDYMIPTEIAHTAQRLARLLPEEGNP